MVGNTRNDRDMSGQMFCFAFYITKRLPAVYFSVHVRYCSIKMAFVTCVTVIGTTSVTCVTVIGTTVSANVSNHPLIASEVAFSLALATSSRLPAILISAVELFHLAETEFEEGSESVTGSKVLHACGQLLGTCFFELFHVYMAF